MFSTRSSRDHLRAKYSPFFGEAAFEEALERGRAMTFEQAVAYALSEDGAPDRERL